MSININPKTDYSSLFGSLNNGRSSSALTDLSWLSEYASIKSGSYGKLMKAYYASDVSEEVQKTASKEKIPAASNETKAYNKVATAADSLQTSITSVGKIGAKGDSDELYTAVNSFVKDYNSLVEATEKVSDTNVTDRVKTIETYTKTNEDELKKLGITLDKEGKLNLDKDAFYRADKGGIDKLFASRGSYGYAVSVSAGMAQSSANYDALKESTYTSAGKYSSVTGSLWDSIT